MMMTSSLNRIVTMLNELKHHSQMKIKHLPIKRSITLAIFMLLTVSCFGQAALFVLLFGDKLASEELHLSIDGAINSSYMTQVDQGKTYYGLNFGLGVHIKLNDSWKLIPQFRPLSQKGMRNIVPVTLPPGDFNNTNSYLRLNYIEFPIMIRYKILPRLFAATGPQISFLTSARQITEGTYGIENAKADFDIDVKSYFNNIDYSVPIELGYLVHLSTKKTTSVFNVILFARYCQGLKNVFKTNIDGKNPKFSTFQFGFCFPYVKDN